MLATWLTDKPNYVFVKADIVRMQEIMKEYQIDSIIHLAAESHLDRSIKDPFTFARTKVKGMLSLPRLQNSIGRACERSMRTSVNFQNWRIDYHGSFAYLRAKLKT